VDLDAVADRVVCLSGPAAFIRHRRKIIVSTDDFLRCRDDIGEALALVSECIADPILHRIIASAERSAWAEAERVFSSSIVERDRLWAGYGIGSTVAQFPISDLSNFSYAELNNEFVCITDDGGDTQLELLVNLLRLTTADIAVRIWSIGGGALSGGNTIAARAGSDRIFIDEDWRSDTHRAQIFSTCRGVISLVRGSAFGVNLAREACMSEKVVVTRAGDMSAQDPVASTLSGKGCCVDIAALPLLLERLRSDDKFTRSLGAETKQKVADTVPSWTSLIHELLE
jgi:hypothetical protein